MKSMVDATNTCTAKTNTHVRTHKDLREWGSLIIIIIIIIIIIMLIIVIMIITIITNSFYDAFNKSWCMNKFRNNQLNLEINIVNKHKHSV